MATSFLTRLPRYIFKSFAQDWLTGNDVARLDVSLSSKDRQVFVHNAEGLVLSLLTCDPHTKVCFDWLETKKFRLCGLKMSLFNMEVLQELPSFSRLVRFDFTGHNLDFFWIMMKQACPVLEDLSVTSLVPYRYCRTGDFVFPPRLKRLALKNFVSCIHSEELAPLFANVGGVVDLSLSEHAVFDLFLMNPVLQVAGPTLTRLTIDLRVPLLRCVKFCPFLTVLHTSQCTHIDMTRALPKLPHLQELTIRTMRGRKSKDLFHFTLPSLTKLAAPYEVVQELLQAFPNVLELKILTEGRMLSSNTAAESIRRKSWMAPNLRVVDLTETISLGPIAFSSSIHWLLPPAE